MDEQSKGSSAAPTDEIDLVDLGVALLRRWKLILAVVALCTAAGVVLAIFKVPVYSVNASLQLPAYTTADGREVQLLSAQSAGTLLQNGLIDQEIQQYASTHKLDPRKFKVSVQTPKDSDIVILSAKGPLKLQDALSAIEKNATTALAANASGQIKAYQAGIQSELARAKLDLANLQDPQRIAAAKALLAQRLSEAQAQLSSLHREQGVLQSKGASLVQATKLYQGLAHELKDYLTKARENGLASAQSSKTASQGMTALLLGNQIQQNLSQLTDIDHKLSVTLPQQIAQTNADLANNQQAQLTQQTAVERAKLAYQNFDAQYQRQVQAQQVTINKLQDQLNNIQSTRLIAGPARSIEPVGMSRKVIVALAFVMGMFVALLTAGLAGYLGAVRRALARDRAEPEG